MTLRTTPALRRASVAAVTLVALIGLSACSSDDTAADDTTSNSASDTTAADDMDVDLDSFETEDPTDTAVTDLKVGDCMDDADATGLVSSAGTVPCDQPHTEEIYAQLDFDGSEFPEDLDDQVDAFCTKEFGNFIGLPYEDSVYGIGFMNPTVSSWEQGDRSALCIVNSDEPVTGTLAGSAL